MSIIGLALAGILAGSLLHWAGDYLVRYALRRPASWSQQTPRLLVSVWCLLTSLRRTGVFPRECRAGALIEVSTAAIFALLGARSSVSGDLPLRILAVCFFILIAIIDLRYRLVLNVMIYPALAATVLARFTVAESNGLAVLVGGAFGFSTFAAAALVRPGELGWGDVKLATLIGLVFGFPLVIWTLLGGVLSGGAAAILLLGAGRGKLKSRIPYAPFLAFGAIAALVFDLQPLMV